MRLGRSGASARPEARRAWCTAGFKRAVRVVQALALLLLVSAGPVRAQAMRNVEHRARLDAHGDLRVWNLSGSIRVTGWDKDSILVRGQVPADQHFGCGGDPGGFKCFVDLAPRYDGIAPGSTLEIFVPRTIQLWVKSGSADIVINNFNGNLDAYSVSGRIQVQGQAQTLALESMSGRLTILATATTLRAKTAGGAINITGDVDDAQVTSVSGSITVANAQVQRGRFESIGGNTTWRGSLMKGASLEFSSHSGAIELLLPGTSGGHVAVNNFAGEVHSEFATDQLSARETKAQELSVMLPGKGDARIVIRNFKGPVRLLKQ